MAFRLLLYLSLTLVFAQDFHKSFFVLDDNQPGIRWTNSTIQDKNVFICTQNKDCKYVIKDGMKERQSSMTWYKQQLKTLSENIKQLVPSDCLSRRLEGWTSYGIYYMVINGKVERIPCDMTTDRGGWTIFQRRVDGTVGFYRSWNSYKRGFGDRAKNVWLGLDLIHYMISQSNSEMRIDLTHYQGDKGYAKYDHAYVSDESQEYQLRISGYSGTAGDSLKYHDNMKFTTYDRDNDLRSNGNCAREFKGGFWFNQCYGTHPNGLYPTRNQTALSYMSWYRFKYNFGGIIFIEMKFRRKITGNSK